MPKVIFRDHFKLVMPNATKLQEFNDSISTGGHKLLRVEIEATHAGITNKNNRFYIPSRMKDGAAGFMKGKRAPILKHHKDDEDPVGKVQGFEYIDTTPESIKSLPEVVVLNDSQMPLKKQVRAARKLINSGITGSEDWKGLGKVKLYADIVDETTIKQIETKVFDAVSIGFSSNHAFCSICQADWMNDDDGLCEHFPPGKVYKDEEGNEERQYLIPGDIYPKECSLVNFDADPHTNITLSGNQFGDSEGDIEVKLGNVNQDALFDANMTWEVRDFEEAADMKTIKVADGNAIELSDVEEKIFNVVRAKYDDHEVLVAERAKQIAALRNEEGFLPDQKDAELDEETAILYAYEAIAYDGEKVDEDAHYEELAKELEKMAEEGLLPKEQLADAKLSASARKGMSTSTFCGPDRSFPVPDCAHVTAARRLIGRYKGPGNKSTILACVSRKAKALGCSSGEDSAPKVDPALDKPVDMPCNELKKMSDEEIRNYFHSVEMELIDRKLTVQRECSECAVNLKKAEEASVAKKEVSDKLEVAEQTLTILRDELRTWAFDYKEAISDSVEVRFELDQLRKKFASVASVLSKKQEDVEKAEIFFRDAKDFNKEYDSIMKDFNAKEIFSKLNDGTSHEPEGTVKDPTVSGDRDNEQHPEGLSKSALAVVARIKEMVKDGEQVQARRLFDKMKSYEVFTDTMNFETIISAANSADE